MSKKFNLKSILLAAVIIFFELPVKVFLLIKFFLQQNKNLHESLVHLYFLNYWTVNDKKIEVIFKKIYLNPLTQREIFQKIIYLNPGKTPEEIAKIYARLVETNRSFMLKNNKLYKDLAPFVRGYLTTEEGFKVKVPHWTNTSDWKINGERMLCAVHATSNTPEKLTDTQFKSVAMQELVQLKSNKPGSVITHGNYIFRPLKSEQKLIKFWQLDYVMYNVYKKDLNSPFINDFIERDATVCDILGPQASYDDISEFSACIHNDTLSNDYDRSISELLLAIKKLTH